MKGLEQPVELEWAERLVRIARMFGVLPSAVLREDAELLRMLELLDPDCGKAED